MKSKRGLQISFAWIFAIIVGAFILFLAIYFSTKIIHTEQKIIDSEGAKRIGILLNPLETGSNSIKATSMTLPTDTQIYAGCENGGFFGNQFIRISQKSFGEWTDTDVNVAFKNKYIFSDEFVEGKKFYLFSVPFNFPFKVSNLIIMTSADKKYCFENVPEEIERDLEAIGQENFLEECTDSSVKVCFGSENCDVNVNEFGNYVEKNNERIYFEGDSLMYAAIFSDNDVYECQVKRLMQRVEMLSFLYRDKAGFVSGVGCNSDVNIELTTLGNLAKNLESSSELEMIMNSVEEIKDKNDYSLCKLW